MNHLQAVWPIGGVNPDPAGAANDFFKVWLALPILLVMWGVAAYFKGTKPLKASEIDLDVSLGDSFLPRGPRPLAFCSRPAS